MFNSGEAEGDGLGVTCIGLGGSSPDVATELIQQQHEGKRTLGFVGPVIQVSLLCLLAFIAEAFSNALIKTVVLTKPLLGF